VWSSRHIRPAAAQAGCVLGWPRVRPARGHGGRRVPGPSPRDKARPAVGPAARSWQADLAPGQDRHGHHHRVHRSGWRRTAARRGPAAGRVAW